MAQTINVTSLINDRPISKYQLWVFILCALAALMDGYDSSIIGITAPAIATSLGLDVKTFGPVFSAAQFGFMLGAFTAGPIADRMGRKTILVAAVVVFGFFSLVTPFAGTYSELLILRFITGLGLGGASATFVSVCTEYAPLRVKATIVAFLWTLLPAGNVVGGVLSSVILPVHGWEPVYYIGGVVPLAIALVMVLVVPESVSFLVARRSSAARIRPIVSRLAPEIVQEPEATYVVNEEKLPNASVKHLFTEGRALVTLCLWVSFFCCWLVLITVVAWTVPVLREAGISITKASLVIATNNGGAIFGAILIGRLMDKTNPLMIIISGLFVGAVAVMALGYAVLTPNFMAVFFFIAGFTVGGTSAGMIALAATSYPTAIRSTGIGWAIGMSRFGAVVGPIAAGMMLSAGWTLQHFFAALGFITVISALALVVMRIGINSRGRAVESVAH